MACSAIERGEHRGRVEVRERVRGRRVGEVVGRDVDRLHGRDRALARGGDALLQLAHLGGERRLVADRRRHPAQERGDLGARLHEAEDVVDEEEDVLALLAEVLGHRQAREADAQARAGRLVHLAEDERGLLDHARLGHLAPEVVALARALAHAGEDGEALVLGGDVADQLLDEDGLAHSGAAEEADLAALHVGREQVDHLDAGLEDLDGRLELFEVGRRPVDRPALTLDVGALVDGGAEDVEDPAERGLADRDGDRGPGVLDVGAAGEAVRGVHRHRADAVVPEVLLHLGDQVGRRAALLCGDLDAEGVVDARELALEGCVDDDALDLDDLADVLLGGHGSPG